MPGRPIPHRRGPEITDEDMVSINGVLAEAYGPNGVVRKAVLANFPPLPPAVPRRQLTEKELDELLNRVNRGTMPVDVEDLVRDLRAARAALRRLFNAAIFCYDETSEVEQDEWLAAEKDALAALPPE